MLVAGAACLVCGSAAGDEDAPPVRQSEPERIQELEPERIDVVFSRLARQGRTLEALLEIVEKLETVADHPAAAAALLSDEGEPIDRLRSARAEVAKRRARSLDSKGQVPPRPEVVARTAEPTAALRPEVVYVQMSPGGARRVLLAARGVRFEAAAGRTIRLGGDAIHVLAIRPGPGGGVDVELSVNDGAPFVRRVER